MLFALYRSKETTAQKSLVPVGPGDLWSSVPCRSLQVFGVYGICRDYRVVAGMLGFAAIIGCMGITEF